LSQERLPLAEPRATHAESPLYGALRNTLVAVSVLFAVYLVFEFKTLWFRRFPPGFYYAGYAHQGAAWLTAALALATAALSAIFRGPVLRDPRLPRLRRLGWVWSGLNLVLALTVYHRMYIYIDFNGMTWMRTVGLFGISAVVVGFCLVLWKIVFDRDFAWLLRRQLWTVGIAVFLFALTPVDSLVHAYNVRQVLAGDLAPAVQISEHPISTEGVLVLRPLVDCDDPIIREGIRALLAERALQGQRLHEQRNELGWTSWQLADAVLLERLNAARADWDEYRDDALRAATLSRFREYAYQWY
jgi:Arc/MetJ-type ribon-helix-helix transcriptional regulator